MKTYLTSFLAASLIAVLITGAVFSQQPVTLRPPLVSDANVGQARTSPPVPLGCEEHTTQPAVTNTTMNVLNCKSGALYAIMQGLSSGSSFQNFIRCDSSFVYDTNTNGKTQLVSLSSGQVTYVCGLWLGQSTTSSVTVSLGSGTGTNCGTTYTAKTPAWVLPGPASATLQPIVLPVAASPWFQTAVSEELCASTNAGVSVQILGSYARF